MVLTSTVTDPEEQRQSLHSTFASRYVRDPVPKYVPFSLRTSHSFVDQFFQRRTLPLFERSDLDTQIDMW